MFANESIVAILFRLINFGVLAGVLWYMFKRYMLQDVKDQMRQKETARQDLLYHKISLEMRQQDIVQQIADQDTLGKSLTGKVQVWREAFVRVEHEREMEKDQLKKALDQRAQLQHHYMLVAQVQKRVVPHVVAQTRTMLEQKFTSPDQAKGYLGDICAYLKQKEAR